MQNRVSPIGSPARVLRLLLIMFLGSALFMVAGCATSSKKLSYLSLGMTKDQVRKVLGDPTAVPCPGIRQEPPAGLLEVWEYLLDNGTGPDLIYWLIFTDGKLTDWRDSASCEKIRQMLRNR